MTGVLFLGEGLEIILQYFNNGETYRFHDYLFPGGFLWGRHFDVTRPGALAIPQ